MNFIHKFVLLFFLGLASSMASATVSVYGLNYPVWVERGSKSLPLAPGDLLRVGDIVQTGATGRVWLETGDGSVIKLGQGTRFRIDRAAIRKSDNTNVLEAAFNVLKGAFRFTSRFFTVQQPTTQRVDFQVGTITAGIRGTDIWGRSAGDEDFVALLEGRVEVASANRDPVVMNQALTLYRKANGVPADPVARVDAAVADRLKAETELDASAGIARASGVYSLVLQSYSDPGNVDEALKRFRDAGYAVKARVVDVDGKSYTRLQLGGLIHLESANNLRQALIDAGLVEDAWINPFE